jgi:cation transport protein ChaC
MSDFWVFGYGSLMWRPGFAHRSATPALLRGAHRSLCVYSHVHRGTRERPGLVLGLDRGGACRGIAFHVAGADREAVIGYLRDRELVTSVYREVWREIVLLDESRRTVRALAFVVDRGHKQYAGVLPRDDVLAHVVAGHGRSGANTDYVLNTVRHLRSLGLRDPKLEWLADRIGESVTPQA